MITLPNKLIRFVSVAIKIIQEILNLDIMSLEILTSEVWTCDEIVIQELLFTVFEFNCYVRCLNWYFIYVTKIIH